MSLMTTSTIWILFPLVLSILLMAVHRLQKLSDWIACLGSLFLSIAAFVFPETLEFSLGSRNYIFDDTFLIFNRALTLTATQLRTVAMFYLFSFLWNIVGARFSDRKSVV